MGKGYVFNCAHFCMYICIWMSLYGGWAIVNTSLQIMSDENRIKLMDRDCFFMGWARKSGKDKYRGKEWKQKDQ